MRPSTLHPALLLRRPALLAGLAGLLLAAPPGRAAERSGPPRDSPRATLQQSVGVCTLTVSYGRPAAHGNVVWGEQVPWNELWAIGANEAATLTLSHPARVQGEPLAAGTYALFAVPSRDAWTLIFNRNAEQWGASGYDATQDALRVTVRARQAPFQERLLIDVPEVGTDTATVQIRWGAVAIPFEVTFDVRTAAIEEARDFVAHATPADGSIVWNWANYFYQGGFNTAEALDWASALVDAAPMYFTYALQARLLAANGQTGRAVEAARRALELAGQQADQPGVTADAEELTHQLAGWQGTGN
jgi:Protein of unknown function (DUF2911)